MEMMSEWVRAMIRDGARGTGSHADVVKAVSGLSLDAVMARPGGVKHNIWQNLWHAVFWQRTVFERYGAEEGKYPKIKLGVEDFPQADAPASQEAWDALLREFTAGVEETERLASEADLSAPLAGWDGITLGYGLHMLGLHAGYHIGQIAQTRMALNLWPPPT